MMLREKFAFLTRRSESVDELTLEGPHRTKAIVAEVAHVCGEAALRHEADNVAHIINKCLSPTGGERHNGTFLKNVEPQMPCDQGVDQPQTVEETSLPLPLQPIPVRRINA